MFQIAFSVTHFYDKANYMKHVWSTPLWEQIFAFSVLALHKTELLLKHWSYPLIPPFSLGSPLPKTGFVSCVQTLWHRIFFKIWYFLCLCDQHARTCLHFFVFLGEARRLLPVPSYNRNIVKTRVELNNLQKSSGSIEDLMLVSAGFPHNYVVRGSAYISSFIFLYKLIFSW